MKLGVIKSIIMSRLQGKKVIVGVTGGVATYKVCSLVNLLIKEGVDVKLM